METFDVVIIGSGPGAKTVWESLRRGDPGRSIAVVEQGLVGGNCPYLACVPSKTMLRGEHVWGLAAHPEFMPLFLGPEPPETAYRETVKRRDRLVNNRDDAEAAEALVQQRITLYRGHGTLVRPGTVDVAGERIGYRDLVLDTGSVPVIPPITGIGDVPAWTTEEALSTPELPGSMVVLGGGPSGCELTDIFALFGCVVTVVESADRLLPREEPEVAATVTEAFHDLDVRTLPGTTAVRTGPRPHGKAGVYLEVDIGRPIEADRLVLAAGRLPNTTDLGLGEIGVEVRAGSPAPVDDHCRVAGTDHVWAVGDITGINSYTHTAEYQGRIVAANLQGRDAVADYRAIPRTIFTEPGVAAVGHTEATARAVGIQPVIATADLAGTVRAKIDGVSTGYVKLIADPERGTLIGATGVGGRPEEWISQLSTAVRAEIPVPVLADVVHPFPAFSGVLDAPIADLADRVATSRAARVVHA
ncbi:dihydrolipoyl dehydrogenase family protein [Pseudonocardia bannensis]|uniref:NAD(P)/FAD-dependent oxidoreductase n=1 Tax=Pseudonocardia bannensis TaxID=630973 RepID=A0A848DF87_9PSEU|nr:NAD(P)/FAD-dependent oxidoreductase [Pseudonocardia bannensis]NMH91290.1 NAD(P)/FAD-dependent oxidoreductase [Pseudonocardia bannensis]